MITFAYEPVKQKDAMRQFFTILPFVLPCKYCRANLVEHYEALPLEPALESRESLTRWFYKIHNLVNAKLREQGQKIPEDPPFSKIKEHYEQRLAYGCSKTMFPGWEFLFSIIESHPLSKSEKAIPFPEAPPKESLKSRKELLQWNYLPGSCRFSYVCRFWKLLPDVLPFEEWRNLWKRETKECCTKTWANQESARRALWKTRKTIEEELQLLNRTSYYDLCKILRYYKSGCAHSQKKQTRTCRRLRTTTRKHRLD
jgi:hypothetical protein